MADGVHVEPVREAAPKVEPMVEDAVDDVAKVLAGDLDCCHLYHMLS